MTVMPTSRPADSDPPSSSERPVCTFGLFELEMSTGELRRSGRPIRLAPQPTRLLVALVERAGQIVTREELKRSIWGDDTFVDFEQGLNFCIRQIRGALGDNAENPRFIETLPRRGYRMMAPVARLAAAVVPSARPETHEGGAVRRFAWATWLLLIGIGLVATAGAYLAFRVRQIGTAPTRTMIAVLPFQDVGGDPEQQYFSDGFTGELIAQLGRLNPARIGVIARTSTLAYRDTTKGADRIGRELGAQHLVEGTVRRSGDRVRISAQLIRVSDQSHVWAEIFEGDVRDILRLQQDVGHAIAQHVVVTLGPAAGTATRTVEPDVYELYLRGRFLWNRRRAPDADTAVASFQEAVRRDPMFAPAYAGLADAVVVGSRPAALAAADKALAIDDGLAEAHSAKAHALMHRLQWDLSEAEFRRSIALDPSYVPAHYFYSEYLLARGRCPEARAEAMQGMTLDPLSAIATHVVGVTLYYCRDYEASLPYFRKALELDPGHHWSHYRMGLVFEQQHAYAAALAEHKFTDPLVAAYAYALTGRTEETRAILSRHLARPEPQLNPYFIAEAYVGLGEYDEALKWLAVAVERQIYQVVFLQADPRLDPLRSRPEFQSLLHTAGWQ